MANQKWVPDIVVGIDFGMTCTGMFRLITLPWQIYS